MSVRSDIEGMNRGKAITYLKRLRKVFVRNLQLKETNESTSSVAVRIGGSRRHLRDFDMIVELLEDSVVTKRSS